MTLSIIAIVFGTAAAMFCMIRSWQCFRRSGDTRESRVVSVVVSIAFGLIGTYMSTCVWREFMGVWEKI